MSNTGIKNKLESLGDKELTLYSDGGGIYIQHPAFDDDKDKFYFVRIEGDDCGCVVFANDNSERFINIDHIIEIQLFKPGKKWN